MKTEDLKAQGLTDEQIKFVMAESGKDVEAQKALTAAESAKVTAANKTIGELQETVKKFDGVDVEKLQKDISDWEQKYNAELSATKLDNALHLALIEAKAKNPKLAKAALDVTAIKLDGENLLGFTDQLEKLKASDSYLFEAEEAADGENQDQTSMKLKTGGTHGSGSTTDYDKMSDDDYYTQYYKKKGD